MSVLGFWNFGDIGWSGTGPNPVIIAALGRDQYGFYDFLRLTPESIADYNLSEGIFEKGKTLPVTLFPEDKPEGMNFFPGGMGYDVNSIGTRIATYRKYHGGSNPPWYFPPSDPTDPMAHPKPVQKKWYRFWK